MKINFEFLKKYKHRVVDVNLYVLEEPVPVIYRGQKLDTKDKFAFVVAFKANLVLLRFPGWEEGHNGLQSSIQFYPPQSHWWVNYADIQPVPVRL